MNILTKIRHAALVTMALLVLVGGCSEHATDPQPIGNLVFNLKPAEPLAAGAASRAQATIIPLTASDAEPVILELSIAEGIVEGHADAIPNGRTLIIVEVWDESGALILQGREIMLVAPGITRQIEISLDPPPERIDNDIVYLHFDHAHACIDSLTLKTGSNLDLLDQTSNTELSQYGLGGLAYLEDHTQLVSFQNYGDSVVLSYANAAAYGTKTFHLRWSED